MWGQEARCPRFAPVPCIFRPVTLVLRALARASSYSEETAPDVDSYRSPCAIRPAQFACYTFHNSGTVVRSHPLFP